MRKISIILYLVLMLILYSCHDKQSLPNNQALFINDLSFRLGKWYSVTPWTNQAANPDLDTIWFINDTLAGWSTFVPGNLYAFAYLKTYFPDQYHIAIIAPNTVTSGMDTGIYQCGMTSPSSDTLIIWWQNGSFNYTEQRYVKKTN